MLAIIIFFVAHWYLSLFTQSVFHHRYAAHQMFTMSKGMEKLFFVMSWVFQGSSYLSPRTYGILHRMHHAHADTELDPHSPKYDSNPFTMMWRTKNEYNAILKDKVEIDKKWLGNLPDWRAFDMFGDMWGSRLFWAFFYIAFYIYFAGTDWWWYLLLPIHFVMGPFHGVIINWFAHKYGYRNFKMKDTSKNLLPFDFLMWGESYHNNHHKHGGRANFGGIRWHEIDPGYIAIRIMNALGIVKMRRSAS